VIGWVWASPTLVQSMSSFVCTVRMYIRRMLWPVRLVTCITHRYYHQVRLLSCTILSLSSSNYVQRWGHAWATPTDWEGKDCRWDLGQKSHCIALLIYCYLTHARPTMFYTQLCVTHMLAAYQQPGNKASCQYELVDATRVCSSNHEVRVRLETLFRKVS